MTASDSDRSSAQESAYAACLLALRDSDRDRYLACLLTPEAKRGPIAALYAFNAEIARIRDMVREPLPGEVRLQWWRDLIEAGDVEAAGGHPVATALLATIHTFDLPRRTFANYLEARTFDLYDDTMPNRNALEGYAGETASALIQLAALVLDPSAARMSGNTAGHAGVAQTIAGMLLLMPIHSARGQVYVPGDILSACGLDRDAFLASADVTAIRVVTDALAALGREHLEQARSTAEDMAPTVFPAFLPVALVERVFDRATKSGAPDPRSSFPQDAQWRRQWRLFQAARRGRF